MDAVFHPMTSCLMSSHYNISLFISALDDTKTAAMRSNFLSFSKQSLEVKKDMVFFEQKLREKNFLACVSQQCFFFLFQKETGFLSIMLRADIGDYIMVKKHYPDDLFFWWEFNRLEKQCSF